MRSTQTGTAEFRLHWERTHGANAGVEAGYGDWQFRVYAWQQGSYLAIAVNQITGETFQHGRLAREIPTLAHGMERCERIFWRLREEDRAAGRFRE